MTRVLGLAFSGHGTSACLVEDGTIVRAINLERITRRKFSRASLPGRRALLQAIGHNVFGEPKDVHYYDVFEVFPDLLEYTTGSRTIAGADLDLVVKTPDNIKDGLVPHGPDKEYRRFLDLFHGTRTCFELEHHLCHAYQAFLTSPFERGAVLTVDGTGEPLERRDGGSICASLGIGEGTDVTVLDEISALFSLGGLYATHTRHLGFDSEQAGNTMALAAFGDEEYWEILRDTPTFHEGGTFEFDFDWDERTHEWDRRMRAYCPPRERPDPIEAKHFNLAYGVQRLTEECVLHAVRELSARTGMRRLAVAGGVGLNCVANARILRETPIEELHVMPNAGDRGLAAGAALYGHHVLLGHEERRPPSHDYLGKTYGRKGILAAAEGASGIRFRESRDIATEVGGLVADGKIVGWMQGGCEFGPRALGHRSILADPRTGASKERLDHQIKRREWFRPYAPSVLAEHADDYFETNGPSPFMLQAVATRPEKREEVAGIVHVDGSARVQTVEREVEPRYYRLISAFHERTGVPLVLNTSFNRAGEPIVETPEDAISAMRTMGFDALAVGDVLIWSEDQGGDPHGGKAPA